MIIITIIIIASTHRTGGTFKTKYFQTSYWIEFIEKPLIRKLGLLRIVPITIVTYLILKNDISIKLWN